MNRIKRNKVKSEENRSRMAASFSLVSHTDLSPRLRLLCWTATPEELFDEVLCSLERSCSLPTALSCTLKRWQSLQDKIFSSKTTGCCCIVNGNWNWKKNQFNHWHICLASLQFNCLSLFSPRCSLFSSRRLKSEAIGIVHKLIVSQKKFRE